MEIASLVLEYIRVLIYPLILLAVIVLLRDELKALLAGELTAKYKELSLTIKKKSNEVEAIQKNIQDVSKSIGTKKDRYSLKTPNLKSEKPFGFRNGITISD
jgi:hypothetical protein